MLGNHTKQGTLYEIISDTPHFTSKFHHLLPARTGSCTTCLEQANVRRRLVSSTGRRYQLVSLFLIVLALRTLWSWSELVVSLHEKSEEKKILTESCLCHRMNEP